MSRAPTQPADDNQRVAHAVCRECCWEHLVTPEDGVVIAAEHRAEAGHETDWKVLQR